jgi:hypothetical protein
MQTRFVGLQCYFFGHFRSFGAVTYMLLERYQEGDVALGRVAR